MAAYLEGCDGMTGTTTDILDDNIGLLRQGLRLIERLDPALYAGRDEPRAAASAPSSATPSTTTPRCSPASARG